MAQVVSAPTVASGSGRPNVYTALLVVAIFVLLVAVGYVAWFLTAPSPTGYGLEFADLFQPWNLPMPR